MDLEEVKERTRKKKEDNNESKKHKRGKGTVHKVTREPTPKCVVCHGPHQVISCKNWSETSIANRWEIAKKNELCYRSLKSGHQGKNKGVSLERNCGAASVGEERKAVKH